MKIWGEIPKISGVYDRQKNIGKVEKASGISSKKKDVVSISNQAKDFQTVLKALKEVPDVRQDKVMELSEKLESGKYDVKGRDVAERILKSIMDRRV